MDIIQSSTMGIEMSPRFLGLSADTQTKRLRAASQRCCSATPVVRKSGRRLATQRRESPKAAATKRIATRDFSFNIFPQWTSRRARQEQAKALARANIMTYFSCIS